MANVTLDSQTFFTFPLAADRKSTSPNFWARDRAAPAATSKSLEIPLHNIDDRQRGAGGASQDDALLISSDNESDYNNQDDGFTSDISFPPTEELLPAVEDAEPGSVTGVDRSFSVSPGASGNSDAEEPSATEGSNPDDEVTSSQQPQTFHPQRSLAPPSAPALPRPWSASPGPLPVEQEDRQSLAGSASCEAEQASVPENTTCSKPHGRISRTSPPGVEAQHMPSPSRLSGLSPPQLEEGTDRERTPRRESGGESDSNDEDGPPLAKPKFGGRRTMIGHGADRSLNSSRVDPKDRDEVVQHSDGQDSRRRHLYRRRRSNSEDEEVYHPPRASETDQDEEDDDFRPPQRKRLKASSPCQSILGTSTGRRTRSNGGTSGPPQVQTTTPGRKRSGYRSVPSRPSFQGSSDDEVSVQAPMAKFEEWPLEDVVLKRVTANGLATFQLQFVWDSCANHRRKDRTTGCVQYQPPVKRRSTTKRGVSTRARFTPEEDDLLIELKNQGLPWQDIHKQFTDAFPQRERRVGSLQVRYCTKLKGLSEGGSRL